MKDIMVDLETMGNNPNAAIVAIGAVYFDLETGTLGEEFYCTVNLESSVANGGIIDASTVMWWMKQSDEARKPLVENAIDIKEALELFREFVTKTPEDKNVWGNGAAFDNVILGSAYTRLGLKKPWSFLNDRCYRTIKSMNKEIKLERSGTHHNALDDAKTQAMHLMKILYK
jgi:DNA polymerase III epsilon subunit-like protein